MGLRFRKSFKVAPGVKVNLNKKSAGVTIGTKGAHYTVNTSGKRTASVGLPGTGLSYSTSSGGGKKGARRKATKKDTFNKVLGIVIAVVAIACTAGAIKTALDKKAAVSAPASAAISTQAVEDAQTADSAVSASAASSDTVTANTASDASTADAAANGAVTDIAESPAVSGKADSSAAAPAETMVWISDSGKKYHSKADCSGMENATQITLQEALDMGREACKRCNP